MEEVIKFLTDGYPKGKYKKEEIRNFMEEILREVEKVVYSLAKNEKGSIEEIWNKIKQREEVEEKFSELVNKIDRVVVIYFASKFQNNEFVGTEIVKSVMELKQ